jgi:TRAP-type mannitol/chloroaromatic compound transport system permease small subunit
MDTVKLVEAILKVFDGINDWVGKIFPWFVLLMFALLITEVGRRYLLNSPTVWANELTQMLFGVYVIIGGGFIMRSGGHVNVDILFSHFSDRTKAGLDVFTSLLFFAFCGMMLHQGWSMAWESLTTFEHSQSAWNPPIYPIKLAIPLGALLLTIEGISKLIKDIIILAGRGDQLAEAATERETV